MQPDYRTAIRELAARHNVDLDTTAGDDAPFDPVAWRREQVHARLATYSGGEFSADRLPPLYPKVVPWLQQLKGDLADRFEDPSAALTAPWLYVYGRTGSGKSSLLFNLIIQLALFATAHNKNLTWRYVTQREFNAEMKPGGDVSPQQAIDGYKDVDLLGFDDLGAGYMTEYAAECTDRLVDHRWMHRKITVFPSNLLLQRTTAMAQREREGQPRVQVLADLLDVRSISRLQSAWSLAMPEIDYRARSGKVLT